MLNLKDFSVKVTAAIIGCMVLASALSGFIIYRYALNAQFQQLRERLKTIAQITALSIDGEAVKMIPLTRQGANYPQFRAIALKLKQVQEVNPILRYIYILTPTDKENILKFVVDPDVLGRSRPKRYPVSFPGDIYNARRVPEMIRGFSRPSADRQCGDDDWGSLLSGYAPIKDYTGKAIAILGVDMRADDVYAMQRRVHLRAFLVFILGIIISIFTGIFVSRVLSNPVKKLVTGAREIGLGNLHYRIKIDDPQELSELAGALNEMASNLNESRCRLHNYFYDVVQTLVRVIEAKDSYTKGHSERVAQYAEKIARKLGFEEEKIELLKDASLLHDIGKVGVDERILNKAEPLTRQEWEQIRKHPSIGEEILRPVVVKEIIEIIRHHHERFDGKGYPDGIAGEDIELMAGIIAIADSYDAMTSSRAYRPAMDMKLAVNELRKNSGIQFNPEVVEVFLKILGYPAQSKT